MPKDKKDRIPESRLLKALAELEGVAKGDELEDQDPEGGLSPEGEPLSGAAPRGRGEQTKKSRRASASSPFGASSSSSSAESSDDASSDDSSSPMPPPRKSKKDKDRKVHKAARVASSSESDSGSDESDDDSSDGDSDADKSFRQMADDDETMQKGIQVNGFLEAMTDQLSLALLHVKDSVAKALVDMEARLVAHIDDSMAKSVGPRREFEVRLAKGIREIGVAIVGDLLPMADMVKSIADQPAGSPRGKAVLSKSDVNRPPWSGPTSGDDDRRMAGGSEGDYVEELREIGPKSINDWLFKKSASNQLDPNVIMAFEADRYDPAMLPVAVRKAIVDDLVK